MKATPALLIYLLLPWLASADPADPADPAATDKPVAQKSLISVKLSVPADATPTHCPLKVTVRNISNFPVSINDLTQSLFCKLLLEDKDGNPCELKGAGQYLFTDPGTRFGNVLTRLKQGEEKSFVIELSPFCKLHTIDYTMDFGIDADPELFTPEEKRRFEKAYPRPEYSRMTWVKGFKFTVKAG